MRGEQIMGVRQKRTCGGILLPGRASETGASAADLRGIRVFAKSDEPRSGAERNPNDSSGEDGVLRPVHLSADEFGVFGGVLPTYSRNPEVKEKIEFGQIVA